MMLADAARRPQQTIRAMLVRAKTDSLLRNSMYMMGNTIITSFLGYIYWILAAHLYQPFALGLASALISTMTLASNLSNLGIGSTLVHMLPKRVSGKDWSLTVNAGLVTGALAGLVTGVLAAVILPLVSPQFGLVAHNNAYLLAFVVGVPLWTVASLLDSTYVAERAAGNMLLRNALFSVLKILLLVPPVLLAVAGPLGIFGSWVLSTLATTLLGLGLLMRVRHNYVAAIRGLPGQVRTMLSSLAGNHFINLGGLAPMFLLPVFVTARLSAADNAYFYTTWMVGLLFFMVSASVATSLYAEGSHRPENLWRKTRSSAIIIAVLLGPVMVFFLLGGRYVIGMFGAEYPRHGAMLLMLLVISAVPDGITNVYVSILRVHRQLVQAAILNIGMAVITLALAWVLLPPLGIAGVGWAWLTAQTAGSVACAVHFVVSASAGQRSMRQPDHELSATPAVSVAGER